MTKSMHPFISSMLIRYLSTLYRFFTIARVLRTLQLIFAVVVAGLYGVDLAHFTKTHAHADAEWIYAEFIAAVSAISSLIFSFMTSIHVAWSVLDATIFVLWLAQVGVFASIFYPKVRPEYVGSTLSVARMRAAVWIDLINMLLWLLTAVLRIMWCINARKHSRRDKKSGEDYTPFLGLLRRGRGSHRYSDQEYGCLDIGQAKLNGVHTNMSEKKWADGIDFKRSEKRIDGGVDAKMPEKMRSDDSLKENGRES